jgi:MFS family permease
MDGALDLRWIWFANFFQLLGGGAPVLMSMVYTMLADISTDAQRSTAFLYIGTFLMGGNLVAQPITYLAMQRGKWFAFGLGLTVLAISTIVAFCIPETLDKTRAQKVDPVPPVEVQTNDSWSQGAKGPTVLLAKVRAATIHTVRVIRWLFWEQKLVGFLLLSLAWEILGKSVANAIQQQYISKRYRLSFAEASLVDTVGLITTVVILSCVLPYISHLLLTRYGWSARAKDLRLAQASALFTAMGCLLVGISRTLVMVCVSIMIFSLGTGYTYMIRGLMTSLVGAKDLGLLYASISVVESISLLVGMPAFSYLFKFGMHWGGGWIGLPYQVGGLILMGAAILVGGIRRTYIDLDEEEDSPGSGASAGEREVQEEVATV